MDKKRPRDGEVEQQPNREKIIDLNLYRKNKNELRRREYERVLFNRILGVYTFLERQELNHVEIFDISYTGIRFQEGNPKEPLAIGQKMPIRLYFTPSSFLRIIIEVKRAVPFKDGDKEGLEYGCIIDRETKSYEALKVLVSFMYKYSEIASPDHRPPMMWF